jgi:hypothetical protein
MDTVTLMETIKRILREYANFGKPPGEVEPSSSSTTNTVTMR